VLNLICLRKKKRVGFIPRNDVLDIIYKLSYENNISYSKIINILVEEALFQRGLFNIMKEEVLEKKIINNNDEITTNEIVNDNNKFNYDYKNNSPKEKNFRFIKVKEESLDTEIYAKFLMFLQFEERMKKKR